MVPQNAVAVGETDGLDLLGRLVTYTFPDDERPATKVVRAWANHGLDVNDLPDVRSATHLFQSACRSVASKRRDSEAGVDIDVREVVNDGSVCVYQITRAVRDKQARVIEHAKAMTLALDKKSEQITVTELEDYAKLRPLEDAIRTHFKAHRKDLGGQKIRNSVRDTILKVGGQNMRGKPGGLYFVPVTYRWEDSAGRTAEHPTLGVLEGLRGFLTEMYGERADFWWIGVAEDKSVDSLAHDMIAKRFAINVADESRELLERAVQRAAAGMGERGIREDFMTSLYQQQRKLLGAVSQYDQLVTLDRTEVEKNLADLDDAIRNLERLREEGKDKK